MAGTRITKRTVDALTPTGGESFLWDCDLSGFGLRIRPYGAKSYIVQYRAGSGRGGATRRLTLGTVGKLTPDEARALAKRMLGAVASGADPAADRTAERKSFTVAQLGEAFLSEHAEMKRKARTAKGYRLLVQQHITPEFGSTRADKLTRAQVARLHMKLAKTPGAANRVTAVVSSMYGFAGRRGIVPEGFNPARGVERYREEGRERYLTAEELARLGEAIREAETVGIPWEPDPEKKTKHAPKPANRRAHIGPHPAAALRLLLFTGSRLSEVLHLKWAHVDAERGLLFLPDSKTGRKTIVLGAPAMAVLAGLPRVGAYVIAGDDPDKPRSDLKRPWSLVAKHARLDGVRLHDLRHTHASFGAGAGLGLPIIGKLLGHSQPATTAGYAHLDADPLKRARDVIAGTIAAAMGEGPRGEGADVTPMKLRRGA